MKKSARKILSLVLSLFLICALAATAFANFYEVSDVGEDVECNEVEFHTFVGGDGTYAKAEMVAVHVGEHGFSGTVTLKCTYCPEDQNRPSAYSTTTVSHNFISTAGVRYVDYFANAGSLLVDATGTTVVTQTVNGTTYTTEAAPVTIYIN